jgi:hypothetical protein
MENHHGHHQMQTDASMHKHHDSMKQLDEHLGNENMRGTTQKISLNASGYVWHSRYRCCCYHT